MLRRALLLVLCLLVTLTVAARVRAGWSRFQRETAARPPAPHDLRLPAARDHRTRAALDFPGGSATPLDSTARLTVRLELGAELERHYLDSLIVGTDSVIRHWPLGDVPLRYCIVPGGSPGFLPEMVHDVRWAITAWDPTSAGLRLVEVSDTAGAD
ncbi:MAG TPA: hypothetical protein VNH46_11245, partial [Gemmatimonadales bacterium]|nr:hypothetical protein [Gemmatimonadales bacterium]